MAKSNTPPAKTAAELSALLAQKNNAFETAKAECELLATQDTQVAKQGPDPLRHHRQLQFDAELRRDAAKASTEDLRVKFDDAQAREAEEARRRAYDTAGGEHESLVAEILALACETRQKISAIQTRARRVSAAVQTANANLPTGQAPLHYIENDSRLAAGKTTEHSGLFFNERPVTAFDPQFWTEVPVAPPVMLPKKTEAVAKKNVAAREYEPGDFRQPTFVPMPRFA